MPVNPHHSPEEREDAYLRWAYEYEQNLTKTARETGLPLRTLQYWKKVDTWDERYKEEAAIVAGHAFEYGVAQLQLGMSAVAHQIVNDATNNALSHAERIASQKLFLSLFNPEFTGPSALTLIDARSISGLPSSPSPMLDNTMEAQRILEANISKATHEQSQSRRKSR